MTGPHHKIDFSAFDAWLFDLDGVITDTAAVHATAWKAMFDAFLKSRGEPPFTIEGDYHTYVDGRPRYDGVAAFLASRNIVLPRGTPQDAPDALTVCGLGNRKNALFNDMLQQDGALLFGSTARLIRDLKALGKRVAVVTSSKNCDIVLRSVGMDGVFDAKMDGTIAAAQNIPGKPKPDTYLAAAALLHVPAAKAVVIEDAVSGVQAGRAGHFGLVIGIDRHGHAGLEENGADLVVRDLAEITL